MEVIKYFILMRDVKIHMDKKKFKDMSFIYNPTIAQLVEHWTVIVLDIQVS